ncbi:Uma2 family endonuclease [Planktothrix sp. FACHB-1365]|uniref:Uma2 family endonuclease n=1 Tax=Planktothrix sp. FACHB-1365 TaxID=2692855 RepID=UPI001682595B|nr:Uma2 family endonuclease [Planktothrix sp. FACHB-1365]MBD2481656.1 Uma2 family endonuclease [Planktothrix sp. FACHB-1365]
MTIATLVLPEQRTLLKQVSWKTFINLLTDLGNNRSARLYYDQGVLEIMTPLGEHENNNRFIDDLIRAIADELNLNLKKMGSLTLKREEVLKGAEPDSCYYLENEPLVRNQQNIDLASDPPPDLVLEIDITSSSLDKRPIYAAFGVPELWRYNGRKLEVFILDKTTQSYQQVTQSLHFPWLPLEIIPQYIRQSLIDGETATLKAFRSFVRQFIPC